MRIFRYGEVKSTNETAWSILKSCPEFCVSADYQTNGRGRNGKEWFGGESQNLYLSIGLQLDEPIAFNKALYFQAIGALSAKWALDRQILPDLQLNELENVALFGRQIFQIKYPNDVYALDRDGVYKKICGVLIESGLIGDVCESVVVGIGINIFEKDFPENLQNPAISLSSLKPSIDKEEILQDICTAFSHYAKSVDNSFQIWKNLLNIIGKKAILPEIPNIEYIVTEIADDMRLTLKNENDTIIIDNGDSIRYGNFIPKRANI